MQAIYRLPPFLIKYLPIIFNAVPAVQGTTRVKFMLEVVCQRKKSMLLSGRWFWTPMLMKPRLQTRRMSAAPSADRFSGLIHFATSMAHLATRFTPVQATAHSICFETTATKVAIWASISS
jgi:hypothetical protein